MRIGYPCINLSVGCSSATTFRLKSYSTDRLRDTIEANLGCLARILAFNRNNGVFFFRITSDLVPFASHPIMDFTWQDHFRGMFGDIGEFIKKSGMRVSMHPGQYTVLNSDRETVFANSVKELEYHTQVLDLLRTDSKAKVQIHVGGVYGAKTDAMDRFVSRYETLSKNVRRRLVIENDERNYSIEECIEIHEQTGVPVVLDTLHHEVLNNGESVSEALVKTSKTWKKRDGAPIVHYSSQQSDSRPGAHAKTLDVSHFRQFLKNVEGMDFDLMLEVKDKNHSAVKAIGIAGAEFQSFVG